MTFSPFSSITDCSLDTITPSIGYLPRKIQLPSMNSISMPTTLPSATLRTILDKYSHDDRLSYECPSMSSNSLIRCAWTSTNYRYKRQRRVRNHPSRLTNTIQYRSRRMRLHHRKKWLKKFKYDLLKRLREKIKRRGKLFTMENEIILGKGEQFNAEHYVKRELEKAKFYGFRVSPVYDQIREDINRLKID